VNCVQERTSHVNHCQLKRLTRRRGTAFSLLQAPHFARVGSTHPVEPSRGGYLYQMEYISGARGVPTSPERAGADAATGVPFSRASVGNLSTDASASASASGSTRSDDPETVFRVSSKPWGIARTGEDGAEDGARTGEATRRSRRANSDYESYLRPILDRMPVRPERVSSVNGPLMNVTKIDDKTLDVTMTTSFRAHFRDALPTVGRRSVLALPNADEERQLEDAYVAWGDSGVKISEIDSGEFVPGVGGRYSVMTPDDSWNVTAGEMRAPSPAIGWYNSEPSLRTEFLIDPNDVRLHERIAVGGFAEVFKGTWQGTVVAVKQLLERSSEVKEKLEQEVEVLSKLRHPNLLLFMGYCVDPPLICTEFMRRGSLHTILKAGKPLEPVRNHAVALSVARGMSYLHSRSPPILHLDLKSPNILVDDKWRVKIADFGLARMRQATQVSAKSQFHGTPEWMAPEMLRAEDYDEHADSYSFGVVLWELLTARKPWEELHPMQIVAIVGFSGRILELPEDGVPESSHEFTALLCDMFHACTQKDPQSRPLFPKILSDLERARSAAASGERYPPPRPPPTPISPGAARDALGVQLEYISLVDERNAP